MQIVVFGFVIMLVSTACSMVGDTGTSAVIAPAVVGSETYILGQSVYDARCASCHGTDGEGQFPDAPMQPDDTGRYGAPPHYETGHTWHHDDDLLVEIIREGGMGDPDRFYLMPALGDMLTDEEIAAVLAYIKTMWTYEQVVMQRERTIAVREQQP